MESEHSLTIQDRVKTAQNVDELATNGVPENDIMQKDSRKNNTLPHCSQISEVLWRQVGRERECHRDKVEVQERHELVRQQCINS